MIKTDQRKTELLKYLKDASNKITNTKFDRVWNIKFEGLNWVQVASNVSSIILFEKDKIIKGDDIPQSDPKDIKGMESVIRTVKDVLGDLNTNAKKITEEVITKERLIEKLKAHERTGSPFKCVFHVWDMPYDAEQMLQLFRIMGVDEVKAYHNTEKSNAVVFLDAGDQLAILAPYN